MTKIYKNRYIAFIDILGFSILIKGEHDPSIIKSVLIKIHKKYNGHNLGYFYAFSDSIILISKEDSEGAFYADQIFKLTNEICLDLLSHDFLCRGAITFGEVYSDENNIVFGPAYIKAVELEKSVHSYLG